MQLTPKHYKVNSERQGRKRGKHFGNSNLKENDGYLLSRHFLALELSGPLPKFLLIASQGLHPLSQSTSDPLNCVRHNWA